MLLMVSVPPAFAASPGFRVAACRNPVISNPAGTWPLSTVSCALAAAAQNSPTAIVNAADFHSGFITCPPGSGERASWGLRVQFQEGIDGRRPALLADGRYFLHYVLAGIAVPRAVRHEKLR